ncbi:protein ecdysoneless homolog [Gigantopelta aegis]|uniref:protein ecdysoneless homolog n=1 Tax=Gigantopelta aegis TaxID=1735272 RepID=UPI001B889B8E|nr:protein ecdysoneless homolog [Gigantopelta aegis]
MGPLKGSTPKFRTSCLPIKVTAHSSLNSSKGVIRCRDLEGVSEEEICQNLRIQGVTAVRRIKVRRNNDLLPTNTCILTFNVPTLPQSVKAGYLNIPVEPFIPNPLRCFKCQRFGHGQNTCRGKLTCARCGLFDHDSKTCKNDTLCLNCKGNHCAYSRECPRWKLEKRVQQVKVQNKLSFTDARRLVESATPTVGDKSYAAAAAAKVATKSIAVNTDLTWHCDEAKYKKLSDIEKTQKQVQKAAQKQKITPQKKEIETQVSMDFKNPPNRSSTNLPKTGNDTKKSPKKATERDNSLGKKGEEKPGTMAERISKPEEAIEYYLIPSVPDTVSEQNLKAYLEEQVDVIFAHLGPLIIDYIWQNEPFSLTPVASSKGNIPPHLHGCTNYGDNIDDEWFIVFLLFRLTRAFPSLVVQVSDSDGEFLLIEAAEVLPKWLSPETAENRIYIHQGELHIIPMTKSPAEVTQHLKNAVKYVRENAMTTRASPEIQKAIRRRLGSFPEKVKENTHHANVYLPANLSAMLNKNPSLIARGVTAFYYRDPFDLKACRTMQYFKPEEKILSRVKFTRCLYAQLTQQQFLPDRRSGWILPNASDKHFKAHDLGMKLSHGFEILCAKCSSYYKSSNSSSQNGHSRVRDSRWQRYLWALKNSGYFKDELEGSNLYKELLKDAEKFYTEHVANGSSHNREPGIEILDLLNSITFDSRQLKAMEKKLQPSDDDSWLTLTPESLDNMMNKATGKSEQSVDMFDLDSIASSMKAFVDNVSGLDGAEFPKNATDDDEIHFDGTGIIQSMQKIFEFKDDDDCSSSDMSEYDWESDDDLILPSNKTSQKSTAKQTPKSHDAMLDDYMDLMDRELAKTKVGKSFERFPKQNGSNSNGSNTSTPKRSTNSSSQSTPKKSVAASVGSSSQPRRKAARDIDDEDDDFKPVNIDLNIVKNTLQSYSAQQGLPGPASNILNSMGIHVPHEDADQWP